MGAVLLCVSADNWSAFPHLIEGDNCKDQVFREIQARLQRLNDIIDLILQLLYLGVVCSS